MNNIEFRLWCIQELWRLPTIRSQLQRWLALATNEGFCVRSSPWQSCELRTEGVGVLVRRYPDFLNGMPVDCLVIATVELDEAKQGKGWFKAFLTLCVELNPWDAIVIEDVKNERLRKFCTDMGFTQHSDFHHTTYFVNTDRVRALATPALRG